MPRRSRDHHHAYLGEVTFRDTVVQGAHPAIIEPATFTTAERLLAVPGEARTYRAASSSARTGTPIDRYLTAFENSTLDPALPQDRLTALRAKTEQLQARRDELVGLLDQAPAQRKALI